MAWGFVPYTHAVVETGDWTDNLLDSWASIQGGFDVGPYQVTARISRISLHIANHQAEVFGRFGLNRGDVGVLSALRIAGPPYQLSPTRLFKGLMLSSAGITSRLDRLENRGLVQRARDPHDRRGVLVGLTAQGRSVLEQAVAANTAAEHELVAGLGPAELASLAALLKKVLGRLETPDGRTS